jgi:hypothetical protein
MYQVVKSHTMAKKTEYDGVRYDSGFEGQYAYHIDQQLKQGLIKSWERQVNLDLEVNGYLVCQYRIDFVVHHHDGTTEYVETKGRHFPEWKLKWKLFEALYSDKPDVKLTIVQQESLWGKTPKPPKLRKIKNY